MKKNRIVVAAEALYLAQENRKSIPPLSENNPDFNIDDAYAIQLANVNKRVSEGEIISGKKIGLTSEGIQKQLGVSEPDYGHLYKSMDRRNGEIKTSEFLQPKAEAEIAFFLKEDLAGGKISKEDVIQATDYVSAAFEIVDSRISDWNIRLVDTVADNASSGCYVVSEEKYKLDEIDLLEISMSLYKNEELVGRGNSKAVLGNPLEAVAWLANRLWGYGVTLKKGEVILSGAFSAAPEAEKGDVFRAEFTSLGSISAYFI